MIKRYHLPLILTTLTFISVCVVLLYTTLSRHAAANAVFDPEVTFTLPDTSVTYKIRDLPITSNTLIVPSTDNASPTFSYDPTTGTITLLTSPQDYQLNLESLSSLFVTTLPHQDLTPSFSLVPRYAERVSLYNARLNRVYRESLPLTLKDGGATAELSLPPSLLRQIIMPTSLDLSVPLSLDEPVLLNYILPRLTPKQREYFHLNSAAANVRRALSQRLQLTTTPVVLGVDDGPTSQGELAPKYIEVDLSQQKLYFFASGKLAKTYTISTGLDYPTPPGEFKILNKAPLAFSGIYNSWMPYWMAFEYAGDVGAYLGFHEKAYVRIEKGKKIYDHTRQIGDKLTGGCIALSPLDAKEVYDHSDVGMLVRIVP